MVLRTLTNCQAERRSRAFHPVLPRRRGGVAEYLRPDGPRPRNGPAPMSAYEFFSFHTASGANTTTSPNDHSSAGHR